MQRLGDAPGARADLLAADALAPGDVRVARALRALGEMLCFLCDLSMKYRSGSHRVTLLCAARRRPSLT